jgi:hypothetical protein
MKRYPLFGVLCPAGDVPFSKMLSEPGGAKCWIASKVFEIDKRTEWFRVSCLTCNALLYDMISDLLRGRVMAHRGLHLLCLLCGGIPWRETIVLPWHEEAVFCFLL